MATKYVPSSSGWDDNGRLAGNAQLRLKIVSSYNISTNKSTLTITMQAKAAQYSGRFWLLDNALLKLNGTTFFSGGGNGELSIDYYVQFQADNSWHDLIDASSGQVKTWSVQVSHDAQGRAEVTLNATARLYLDSSYYFTFYGLSGSAVFEETRTYTLSISAGTGSTVTVKRGNTTLSNGATITHGDVLTITFAPKAGYNINAHTVNGSTFTSGNTHTVSGAVSVAATATKKTYTLTISAGTGSSITVKRGSTTLSNGATITHGDVLTVTFAASTGYNLTTHTVNGANFTSGNTHTVAGAVSVVSAAAKKTYTLTISAGTGSSITVKRSGTTLTNGATITHGDVLTVTFSASSGYAVATHTVNGSTFTSGNTHTVAGAVSVVATATRQRSTISSCSSQAETLKSIEIIMNRSGSNYHVATVKKGTTTLATSDAFASAKTISVPRSWFSSVPDATSFTVTVSVQSYTDSGCGTTVGSPVTATVTIKADSGMKPVINNNYATTVPYNTGNAAGINRFISGYSKAELTIDTSKIDMSAAVGASIASITVKGGGVTASSAPYRTGILNGVEKITVTVTDTRGRAATRTITVSCFAYNPPRLSGISVFRCNSSGVEDEEGTRFSVTATAEISSLNGANTLTLTANGTSITSGTRKIINASLQPDRTYTVTIVAEDRLGNTATVVRTLPGRKWAMKFRADGDGVAFGKAPEHSKAAEFPEDWTIYVGDCRYWGKRVTLAAGTSQTITLPTYTQFIVSPQRGTTWIVNTRSATDAPNVGVLSNLVSNSSLTCVAASNCAITLGNTSSYSYSFSIKQL